VQALAALLALAACTGDPAMPPSPEPSPREPAPVTVPVIAGERDHAGVLDGMRLAERDVNRRGGIRGRPLRLQLEDHGGDDARAGDLLGRAVAARPPMALFAGPGHVAAGLRSEIEEARVPVMVVEGDLYTPRTLFRWVFQASVPARWRARVLARYLVRDRGHRRVAAVVEGGPDRREMSRALRDALGREGVRPVAVAVADPGPSPPPDVVAGAEAAIVLGGPEVSRREAQRGDGADVRLALPPASLAEPRLPPGTVVAHHYAWAGWDPPLPRVRRFAGRFRRVLGRPPTGLEQEGYDAVRVAATALSRSAARGGERLLRALEGVRDVTHAALPITLGPDDHVLPDETFVGVLAVTRPAAGSTWLPVMRTFTSDGRKLSLHRPDVRRFVPGWRHPRPRPVYRRARFGIVSRPGDDPLH
jgi:branched-chain amino acid transport system substrate-binding protein